MTSTVAFIRTRSRSRGRGKKDPETGPLVRGAHDLDRSSVALHDAVRHEEPQSRTLRPRRVERLEEMRLVLGSDTGSIVLDLDLDARQRRAPDGPDANRDLPPALDRLNGVLDEVQKYLQELIGIGQDLGPMIGTFQLDLDLSLLQGGTERLDGPGGPAVGCAPPCSGRRRGRSTWRRPRGRVLPRPATEPRSPRPASCSRLGGAPRARRGPPRRRAGARSGVRRASPPRPRPR